MFTIQKHPVPNYGTRSSHKPIAIVNHITIGSMQSVVNTFSRSGGNSSHFLVCRDGLIIQLVDITKRAHTNGIVNTPKSALVRQMGSLNANYYTVTIEHEGYEGHGIDGDLTEKQFMASCWLHKWIQTEVERLYSVRIPLNSHQVIAHNQVDSKKGTCPGTKFPWIRLYAELTIADGMTLEAYEERMVSKNGDNSKRAAAYAIVERINELGERLKDQKWKEAARIKLEYLRPIMEVIGWSKDAGGTPDTSTYGIVKRVTELYKTSLGAGKFSDEADRKILLFEPTMRERGVL